MNGSFVTLLRQHQFGWRHEGPYKADAIELYCRLRHRTRAHADCMSTHGFGGGQGVTRTLTTSLAKRGGYPCAIERARPVNDGRESQQGCQSDWGKRYWQYHRSQVCGGEWRDWRQIRVSGAYWRRRIARKSAATNF
jgi:hypothetical protein